MFDVVAAVCLEYKALIYDELREPIFQNVKLDWRSLGNHGKSLDAS
jgi:hypothetical protein